MDGIEDTARVNALYRRLCQIEDLRDRKGDWTTAVYQVVLRFPKEGQQKIKAFVSRRQKENAKNLLAFMERAREELRKLLNAPAETVKKGEEIAAKTRWFGQLKATVVQIDAVLTSFDASTAASLLDYEWGLLNKREEE